MYAFYSLLYTELMFIPALVMIIAITTLQLALIVAQSCDHSGVLSPINLTALGDGLKRVAVQAKKMKG